jgi:hypothetical protein
VHLEDGESSKAAEKNHDQAREAAADHALLLLEHVRFRALVVYGLRNNFERNYVVGQRLLFLYVAARVPESGMVRASYTPEDWSATTLLVSVRQ